MKETGMVRRIDELGRVVIPKEIRRTMRIREGEEMEVFVEDNECVVLKKYSPMAVQTELFKEYHNILTKTSGGQIVICDRDSIVASGVKSEVGKRISVRLWEAIESRVPTNEVIPAAENSPSCKEMLIVPLVSRGDALGAVMMRTDGRITDAQTKLLETAGQLLSLSV